jgi:elongation factor 2 kinase
LSDHLDTTLSGAGAGGVTAPIGINQRAVNNRHHLAAPRRIRAESSCLDSAFSLEEAKNYFSSRMLRKRASNVHAEQSHLTLNNKLRHQQNDLVEEEDVDERESESILGKVHLELCKYHEQGRFLANENDEFDQEAAFFHLKQAANLGVVEALINFAKIHLNLPCELLSNYQVKNSDADSNASIGFESMLRAAESGDKSSNLYIAKAYDTGSTGLTNIDWLKAYEYYQKVLNIYEKEESAHQKWTTTAAAQDPGYFELHSNDECDPVHLIVGRMAEMNLVGGAGLERDLTEAALLFTEAGDKAMLEGKGKLASKYFIQAEEASAQEEEEE